MSEIANIEKPETALVTGSSGYFGIRLVKALAEKGFIVKCLDLMEPPEPLPEHCTHIKGSLTDEKILGDSLVGVNLVFHTASAGMSGSGQLNEKLCKEVNVDGTALILSLCQKHSIQRFVYTSSYNAIFGRKALVLCNENEPYPADTEQFDWYSKTKKQAEKMALAQNGLKSANGNTMYTCTIRPNGIYGENEKKHLPRIADKIEQGVTIFKFGVGNIYLDWVHVDNLVQAHVKAGEKLSEKYDRIAAGKAYNISDDCPVEPYTFFKPLFDAMEQPLPWISIPFWVVFYISWINEILHHWLKPVFHLEPIVTRNEITKVCTTHTCVMDKARKELGYAPKKFHFSNAVAILMKERQRKRRWKDIIADNQYKFYLVFAIYICVYYFLKFLS